MCGIAGFISERDLEAEPREVRLARMCASIRHRGPDDEGMIVRGRVELGMRRLSIIDIKTGQQPIYNEDGNLAIVFNGEIYNFLEVKKELESIGHRFRTNSDTEVIVHAYEEYGSDCLRKLRGMFAFAIWNFREETLFLARDRVGKKPLFYSLTKNGDFVFGSELKALLAHGGIEKVIDLTALDAYLTFGYLPEQFCIFGNVQKLQPGNFLTFKQGRIHTEKYWDFDYLKPSQIKNEDEYIEELREKIKDAVSVRLISEVPLGAFLSGGVDSSTVVAMMSKMSEIPVKTFSIGFNEDSFNELKYARIAAKHFQTEHHEFIVTPDVVDVIDDLVWHFDEPFSDPSALPTFVVSKMAREFVTVVLSGDGGDELFAGYSRYVTEAKRTRFESLPSKFRERVLRPISEKLSHGARGKDFVYNISLDALDRYIDSISQFNQPRRKGLYSGRLRAELDSHLGAGEREFKSLTQGISTGNVLDQLLYLDSKTYLPSDILTKVDRMSMANSLEARAPLLDHVLIDFVLSIPAKLKLNRTKTKYILKKAMEGLIPDEILHREKQGFGVPIVEWINVQLKDRIQSDLSDARTLQRGYFQESTIQTLLEEHSRGRRDHSHRIWQLWMLELWHRQFIDK